MAGGSGAVFPAGFSFVLGARAGGDAAKSFRLLWLAMLLFVVYLCVSCRAVRYLNEHRISSRLKWLSEPAPVLRCARHRLVSG